MSIATEARALLRATTAAMADVIATTSFLTLTITIATIAGATALGV